MSARLRPFSVGYLLFALAGCGDEKPTSTADAPDATKLSFDAGGKKDALVPDAKPNDAKPTATDAQADTAAMDAAAAQDDAATANDGATEGPDAALDAELPDQSDAPPAKDAADTGGPATDVADAGGLCGDGTCAPGETPWGCEQDCPPPPAVCGDGWCQEPENGFLCPIDCDPGATGPLACLKKTCGGVTGTCLANAECADFLGNALSCLTGCGQGEDCVSLCSVQLKGMAKTVADCGLAKCGGAGEGPVCGDAACVPGESPALCPQDCPGKP